MVYIKSKICIIHRRLYSICNDQNKQVHTTISRLPDQMFKFSQLEYNFTTTLRAHLVYFANLRAI